jgi:cardiolipin synthase
VQGYPLYNTLLTLIFNAKKSLNIVTPYFVPDITLFRALSLAVFRGVKVSVVIPEHSNHKSADLARASYVRRLKEAGVVICFFEPRMIHAKVISIDGETAIIGSANFDMRSLFFNFESCLYLYSKPDIVAVDQWIDGLKKQSSCELVWPNPGRLRRMLENVVSLFSPLL